MSDPLLFTLESAQRVLSAKLGEGIERQIPVDDRKNEILRYHLGRIPLDFDRKQLHIGKDYDRLLDHACDFMDEVYSNLSLSIRNAIYAQACHGYPEVFSIPHLVSLEPQNGKLLGLDRRSRAYLQNKVGKFYFPKTSPRSARLSFEEDRCLSRKVIIMDRNRFLLLRKILHPMQITGSIDLLSAGFDTFVWRGADVITPMSDVDFPTNRSFHLDLSGIELALDEDSICHLSTETPQGETIKCNMEIGMQVIMDKFNCHETLS